MKSIRTDQRNHAPEGDERNRTAVCSLGDDAVYDALSELDRVHARLIAAVTPGHPGWLDGYQENRADWQERYDALFSAWHSATRRCRALLGPNLHADPNEARDA